MPFRPHLDNQTIKSLTTDVKNDLSWFLNAIKDHILNLFLLGKTHTLRESRLSMKNLLLFIHLLSTLILL